MPLSTLERAAWLDALSDDDADLRPALRDVLDRLTTAKQTGFLAHPKLSRRPEDDAETALRPGGIVGPNELQRELVGAGWARCGWPAASTAPTAATSR